MTMIVDQSSASTTVIHCSYDSWVRTAMSRGPEMKRHTFEERDETSSAFAILSQDLWRVEGKNISIGRCSYHHVCSFYLPVEQGRSVFPERESVMWGRMSMVFFDKSRCPVPGYCKVLFVPLVAQTIRTPSSVLTSSFSPSGSPSRYSTKKKMIQFTRLPQKHGEDLIQQLWCWR